MMLNVSAVEEGMKGEVQGKKKGRDILYIKN